MKRRSAACKTSHPLKISAAASRHPAQKGRSHPVPVKTAMLTKMITAGKRIFISGFFTHPASL